jgi:hypothetical protein
MDDDSIWQPPGADGPSGDTPEQGAAPELPTLPPATVPTAPTQAVGQDGGSPPPPSPWAPGGEPSIVPPVPPPPPADGGVVPPAMPPFPGGGSTIVTTSAEPTGQRGRRSKWLVGSAVMSVVAVGAAGIFAVANLTGATAGGSATPADLGSELLAAIEGEDVLGVIDVLSPGEREALGEPFVDLVSELQRLEVLAETDLSQIAGLEIDLSNEVVRTRVTNVDDIVNVKISADVEISVDGAELPIGSLVTDNMPDDMLTEMRGTRVTETDEFDITLTAVLEDERWYFSLLHTLAEVARGELAGEVGIPFEGIGSDGAESPEAAVEQLLDRIEALDLTGVLRSLDPSEAAALQRYAPLFLEDAQAELDAAPIDWSITERSIRVEGSGDQQTAFVDGLALEGSLDGSAFTFRFSGDCALVEFDEQRFEQCGDVGSVSDVEDVFGDEPEIMHLIEVIQSAFADIEPVGLELREREGEWFISPIASVTDGMLAVLGALDRQELDEIIDAFEPAFEAITDGLFDSINDLAGSSDFGLAVPDEPALPTILDQSGDSAGDSVGWFDCYDLGVIEATACFQSFVDSGEIAPADVPVVLRYPECGYGEASWGGSVYQLPDDRFIAVVDGARTCFLDLLDTGQVDEWELPEEILHFGCFEGRNWYQVFDDPEYDERFDACRSAAINE